MWKCHDGVLFAEQLNVRLLIKHLQSQNIICKYHAFLFCDQKLTCFTEEDIYCCVGEMKEGRE